LPRGSEGELEEREEWEILFPAREGASEVASLVLGIQSQSAALLSGFSIIMLEEPEQN